MKSPAGNPPEAPGGILSHLDAVAAYEHFARRAVDIFNAEGGIEPQLFFVALDDSEPRNIAFVKALEPEAVASFDDSNEGRARRFQFIADAFITGSATSDALKRQGMPVVPDFVVQVAEVSLHTGGAGDMPGTDDNAISHEAVLVVVFTGARQYAGVCLIHDNPRRCVYGALQDEMRIGLRAAPQERAVDNADDEDDPVAPDEPNSIN
jgi:hypothetical protein